jgi:hypothetical protein
MFLNNGGCALMAAAAPYGLSADPSQKLNRMVTADSTEISSKFHFFKLAPLFITKFHQDF